jgi:hypothetical protein
MSCLNEMRHRSERRTRLRSCTRSDEKSSHFCALHVLLMFNVIKRIVLVVREIMHVMWVISCKRQIRPGHILLHQLGTFYIYFLPIGYAKRLRFYMILLAEDHRSMICRAASRSPIMQIHRLQWSIWPWSRTIILFSCTESRCGWVIIARSPMAQAIGLIRS